MLKLVCVYLFGWTNFKITMKNFIERIKFSEKKIFHKQQKIILEEKKNNKKHNFKSFTNVLQSASK